MLTWVFNSKSNLFEICQQNLTTNLARNSSSDKVGAKSNIRRVGETGRGGGHSVDWVGCGKSTKVVKPGDKIEYNAQKYHTMKCNMQGWWWQKHQGY